MPRDYDDDDETIDDVDIRRSRRSEQVPNYLVQAILVTLCCCMPFGVVAIVNAAKVNTHLNRGEYEQAVSASEEAKKWCWIAFFLGIISNTVVGAFQVMSANQGFR